MALAQGPGGGASALERLLKRRRLIGREGACASSMASSSERLRQLQARYGSPFQLSLWLGGLFARHSMITLLLFLARVLLEEAVSLRASGFAFRVL